ncbi:MAG: hypothetical protein ACREPZ_07745 [Rhodanobacteraceae bacterium]
MRALLARSAALPGTMQRRVGGSGGLLFGGFLLARQEKVTRARGMRTEEDKDIVVDHVP